MDVEKGLGVQEKEAPGDSEDSTDSLKNSPSNRTKTKNAVAIDYKKKSLKFGKVRHYKYQFKNVGSLMLTVWAREEAEKDSNLHISSSNFKRENPKRRLKDKHFNTDNYH